MNRLSFIVCLLIVAISAGCSHRGETICFSDINPQGWAYGDTIVFSAPGVERDEATELEVVVRHNNDFVYSNLWVEVSVADSLGKVQTDTVNIPLADTHGKWIGKGMGESRLASALTSKQMNLLHAASVKLRHVMRADTISGIEQIGMIIDYEH